MKHVIVFSRLRPLADDLDRRRAALEEEVRHYGEYLEQCRLEEQEEEEGRLEAKAKRRVRFRSKHTSF